MHAVSKGYGACGIWHTTVGMAGCRQQINQDYSKSASAVHYKNRDKNSAGHDSGSCKTGIHAAVHE